LESCLPGFFVLLMTLVEAPIFEIAHFRNTSVGQKEKKQAVRDNRSWETNTSNLQQVIEKAKRVLSEKGSLQEKESDEPIDEYINSGQLLKLYFRDIKAFPALNTDELQALYQVVRESEEARRYQPPTTATQELWQELVSTAERSINRLAIAHAGLVVKIARRKPIEARRGLSLIDLVQAGNTGLIIAIRKYDHRRTGNTFSTHAGWWISQAIGRAIDNTSDQARIPVHARQKYFKVLGVISDGIINAENVKEAIRKTGVELSFNNFFKIHWVISQRSLNNPSSLREDEEEIDNLADGGEPLDNSLAKQLVREELDQLTDQQRKTIELYLDGFGWTEIGEMTGTSRQAAQQKGKRAMARMEQRLRPREKVLFQAK
jgi:RNA polymerase primary sigma factor